MNSIKNDLYAFNLLKLYTFIVAVISSLEVLRLSGVYNIAELNKLTTLLIGIPATFIVFSKLTSSSLRQSSFGVLLFVLIVDGILLGMIYNHDLYYIAADIATVLFSLVFLYLFSSIKIDILSLKRYLKWAANILLVMSVLGIASNYIAIFIFNQKIYFSFGGVSLLLPLSYYLIYKQRLLTVFTILTIVAGGKVGVMVAAFIVIIFQFWGERGIAMHRVFIASIVSILFIGLLFSSFVSLESEVSGGLSEGVLGKLRAYSYTSFIEKTDEEMINFGGGRFSEVFYSWSKFSTYSGFPLLTGAGFGFVYDSYYLGVEQKDIHNVHLSFVTILLRHGVILGGIFYVLFICFFIKYYDKIFRKYFIVQYQVLYLFCIGSFVFSFTAFNLFATLFNWMFIGLLLGVDKNINSRVS